MATEMPRLFSQSVNDWLVNSIIADSHVMVSGIPIRKLKILQPAPRYTFYVCNRQTCKCFDDYDYGRLFGIFFDISFPSCLFTIHEYRSAFSYSTFELAPNIRFGIVAALAGEGGGLR